MFSVIEEGKEASVKFYNEWIEEVQKTVPKERLLVFSVKEGWEPLCRFLDLPVPEQPFPRSNDTQFIQKLVGKSYFYANLLVFGLALPALLASIYFYCKRNGFF